MRNTLDLLRPAESEFLRTRLANNICLLLGSRPGRWASYFPFGHEASPPGECPGVEWVYPRIHGRELVFCRPRKLETHAYGITQPAACGEVVDVSLLAGVLVPGLGFDREGGRLGQGQGYYDRALKDFRGPKLGIAFGCQVVDRLPREPWDVKMDAVITNDFVIDWKG